MTAGERDERTELLAKHSFTACFSSVKSVGGDSVLVPRYLIELKAWGTRPTSANLSFIISSGLFTVAVSEKKINLDINSIVQLHLPKTCWPELKQTMNAYIHIYVERIEFKIMNS